MGTPEPFIFAKYCPKTPHNTNQYLINEQINRQNSFLNYNMMHNHNREDIIMPTNEDFVLME